MGAACVRPMSRRRLLPGCRPTPVRQRLRRRSMSMNMNMRRRRRRRARRLHHHPSRPLKGRPLKGLKHDRSRDRLIIDRPPNGRDTNRSGLARNHNTLRLLSPGLRTRCAGSWNLSKKPSNRWNMFWSWLRRRRNKSSKTNGRSRISAAPCGAFSSRVRSRREIENGSGSGVLNTRSLRANAKNRDMKNLTGNHLPTSWNTKRAKNRRRRNSIRRIRRAEVR